jgi:hypothetical protein
VSALRRTLHRRKPASLARTWAFLLAAYILYIPANLLPVMVTESILGVQRDTILSGVIYLWLSGSHMLAGVVLIASIVVPLLKMMILTLLLISVHMKSTWRIRQQTAVRAGRSHRPLVDARYLRGGAAGLAGARGRAGHDHPRRRRAGLCLGGRDDHAGIAELRPAPALGLARDPGPLPSNCRNPTMPDHDSPSPPPTSGGVPQPARKRRARWLPSLVWLIPIVAAVVGVSLLINTLASRGPRSTSPSAPPTG